MKQGKFFKTIQDYDIRKRKFHKGWSFNENTYADYNIQINTVTTTDYLYKGIKHIYYQTKPYANNYHKDIQLLLTDYIISISIPGNVYGEAIQKHSLQIIFGSHNIIDDGKGNLIDNEINYVGNIFYQQGNIIIINKNSCYSDFINSSNFEITFKGTHAIYEHEIFCTINRNEFNCTLNKSAFDEWNDTSSAAPAMKSKFVNNDAWTPYITTIGLYNDNNELMAVGKLARPTQNIQDCALTFVVQFDL